MNLFSFIFTLNVFEVFKSIITNIKYKYYFDVADEFLEKI